MLDMGKTPSVPDPPPATLPSFSFSSLPRGTVLWGVCPCVHSSEVLKRSVRGAPEDALPHLKPLLSFIKTVKVTV